MPRARSPHNPRLLVAEGVLVHALPRQAWLLAVLLAAVSLPVLAQTAAAPARESKEAKEAREAAEAMERARRLAANPLLRIQEAARVRRRGDAEPVAAAAAAPVAATALAATAAEAVTRSAPATLSPPAAAARETAGEAASAVVSSDLSQTRADAEPAPALDVQTLARPLQPAALALPALEPLQPGIAVPTLVRRIDPEIPPRVLVDLAPNTVVVADLTVRPDGSVGEVVLASSSGRALARYLVPALQQWRFEPLPGERPWRVELVLRPE
jgi:hypothetical protein